MIFLQAIVQYANMLTSKLVEGSMTEFGIHLEGIDWLLRELRARTERSTNISRLIAIASFVSVLARTTLLNLPPAPWSNDSRSSDLPVDDAAESSALELVFGITPKLVNLMQRIVELSRNISYYMSKSAALPPLLILASSEVSRALSQWSIDSEPLKALRSGTESGITLRIAKSHILAFAHALRVYYHTRINPCTPSEMARYVALVAEDLVELEEIKDLAGYSSNTAATIRWPAFIASCEAEPGQPRDVWYWWWNRMLKYRIGNISRLWEVVQMAWDLRDNEGFTEVPAWMPVLRRNAIQILAL